METVLLDNVGRRIGTVTVNSYDRQTLLVNGRRTGDYDPKNNLTTVNGRKVGTGNLLSMLLNDLE